MPKLSPILTGCLSKDRPKYLTPVFGRFGKSVRTDRAVEIAGMGALEQVRYIANLWSAMDEQEKAVSEFELIAMVGVRAIPCAKRRIQR